MYTAANHFSTVFVTNWRMKVKLKNGAWSGTNIYKLSVSWEVKLWTHTWSPWFESTKTLLIFCLLTLVSQLARTCYYLSEIVGSFSQLDGCPPSGNFASSAYLLKKFSILPGDFLVLWKEKVMLSYFPIIFCVDGLKLTHSPLSLRKALSCFPLTKGRSIAMEKVRLP